MGATGIASVAIFEVMHMQSWLRHSYVIVFHDSAVGVASVSYRTFAPLLNHLTICQSNMVPMIPGAYAHYRAFSLTAL